MVRIRFKRDTRMDIQKSEEILRAIRKVNSSIHELCTMFAPSEPLPPHPVTEFMDGHEIYPKVIELFKMGKELEEQTNKIYFK